MSYDFNTTPAACDHHVAREPMAFSPDRRTLFSLVQTNQHMARPVNGTATVHLFINDVEVPREHPMLGWDPVLDLQGPTGQRWTMIVFRRVQLVDNWVVEVGYTTVAPYCLKCGGTSMANDYRVGKDGRWARVTGWPKLLQRCIKMVMTSICPFYPALVCALRSQIGKKGGQAFTSDDAAYSVATMFSSLKTIQQAQANFQTLTADEMLLNVGSVSATQDPADPRIMGVSIEVTNYAGNTNAIDLGFLKS